MKWVRVFVLLCTAFALGCGPSVGGSVGDANDPAISGSDQEQANEKDGAVEVAQPEQE